MEHFEKTLESQTLYEGKILNLKRDKVELENGDITYREVVEHSGGVAVVAVDDDGNLLFVSQFRYPFGDMLLEIPAGKLEKGENPAVAGMRELEEECGYTADLFVPMGQMYPTCAYDTEIIHLFFATRLRKTKQRLDTGEFLTVQRIPGDAAIQMVLDGKIPDGKTQLGILKFQAMRLAGKI